MNKETKIKTLTVYRRYFERFRKFIALSEIRLSGKWLEKIGFCYGKKIAVIYGKDRILIINTDKKVVRL